MTARPLVLCALVALGCSRTHEGSSFEVRSGDCVLCHRRQYEEVAQPRHVGNFPETCGDCHSTSGWTPAAGLHPEGSFPVHSGPHQTVTCGNCHDPARGAYTAGENTSCVGCHTGEHERARVDGQHRGIPDYAFDTGDPHFCLSCHPKGLAEGSHPEARFPIKSGAHKELLCLDCHRPERGSYVAGANTDCIGCHTGEHAQARVDRQHNEVGDYTFDAAMPNFCLRCHPSGRGD